jgi:uncharacterized cupin superfamily protein
LTISFRATDLDWSTDYAHRLLAGPGAEPLSGDIEVGTYMAYESPDGRISSGSWESAPGESRWEFVTRGEFITVVAGSMTVQEDGSPAQTLSVGDSAIFPIGWKGIWTVHEHLRKVFVVYRS